MKPVVLSTSILKRFSAVLVNEIIFPVTRSKSLSITACQPQNYSFTFSTAKYRTLCTLPSCLKSDLRAINQGKTNIPSCLWPSNLPPATEWGYGRIGPHTWPEKYPHAGGKHQSPIDIISSLVQSREYDPPLKWHYEPGICKSILNTGCGWRVDVQGDSELTGGPLNHSYSLVQFHCHWGNENNCGSEHTIDGKAYAGELHFVHWNKEIFQTCIDAIPSPKGLTVVGVFLEVGEKNSEIEKLCEVIPNVIARDDKIELECDLDPIGMYPADPAYWTYEGSLTTPPCYESVTWIMFKNPITVSEEQLNCFRHMKKTCVDEEEESESSGFVEHNYRPPQLLNDREICECV